jgi:hypothetical protein
MQSALYSYPALIIQVGERQAPPPYVSCVAKREEEGSKVKQGSLFSLFCVITSSIAVLKQSRSHFGTGGGE